MGSAIPTKLEEGLVEGLDRLVAEGLYQSRSEAIRDSVRSLVNRNYMSRIRFLRTIAEISAQAILSKFSETVTDIIVYGSVANQHVSEDSDVDILVLVRPKRNQSASQVEVHIHEIIYPIALASDSVITPIVLQKLSFLDLWKRKEHFVREIVGHAISLHGMTLNELRKQAIPPKG